VAFVVPDLESHNILIKVAVVARTVALYSADVVWPLANCNYLNGISESNF
jgi:hypothetical protein